MWRSLHFLLFLSLPLVIAFLVGCIKAKEEPADLGPEVAEDQIDLALSKAVNGASLNGLTVGQYVTYSINRRLENEESVIALGATKVDVFDKVETATDVKFTLRIVKSSRLEDGTFETVQTEEPILLKKGNSAIAAMHPLVAEQGASVRAKPVRVTYHRLRETSESIDPPPLVKSRPGCGGLTSCKIPIRYVRYDMVEWYNEKDFRKLAFDLGFSTETPYLPFGQNIDQFTGLLLTNCVATQVQVTGRTVFVRDCISLEDVQK